MKRIIFLLGIWLMTTTSTAQDQLLTLEDVMPGGTNYYKMQPQNKAGMFWCGDICMDGSGLTLKEINPQNANSRDVMTLNEVNALIQPDAIKSFYKVEYPYSEPLMLVHGKQNNWLINLQAKAVAWKQPVPEGADNRTWSKESKALALTIKNNVFVVTGEGQVQQVTKEPEGVLCGHSVHRNEFGIDGGLFWSPNGQLLAFYRMDERMVTDYPQVNTSTRIATLEPDKYPMAGMTSHKVTVGIYNPQSQQTVYLQAGDPTDRYFTNISWAPDNRHIYIIELNRDQNHAQLVRYDAESGKREQVLYEETNDKYVEPSNPLVFLPWNAKECLYQSERDGYNHLYLLNTETQVMKQLTHGDWEVQQFLGFNAKTHEAFIMSTELSPLQSNVFAVNMKDGETRLIGASNGVHNVLLSVSGKYVIDKYSAPDVPRKIELNATAKRGKSFTLLTSGSPWKEKSIMPEITVGTIKAADKETDLYYRLVKPIHFDPTKKYPAIIYVYGGPHTQLVNGSFNYQVRGWDVYMAQRGFIVFTVDNRGSEYRGRAFEDVIHRQLGVEEMKDQMEGVHFLESLGYVDMSRIGIHGWSYGGFMTTNLMLTFPDTFKVGVAGGPVIDWNYYEIMYGERYMDHPLDNPEGYRNANLKLKAGQLKGRLQIIIGGNDPTCVPQHSISFLRACIDAGTHPDFFMYPGDGHNMRDRDRVHLYEHISRYFLEHL